MHKKYDTSNIPELKRNRFYETFFRFFWAFQPLILVVGFFILCAFWAWVILMWLTEPSLTGNY